MTYQGNQVSKPFPGGLTAVVLGVVIGLLMVLSSPQSVTADEKGGRPSIKTTPDEAAAKAKFIKDSEEKHAPRVSFLALRVGGGLLDGGDYNKFAAFNNSNITRTDGGSEVLRELSNSYEIGIEMGVMLGAKSSISLNVDYWLKNGSNVVGDYTFGVAPLGSQTGFALQSEITVYGAAANFGYFLLNPPSKLGVSKGLSVEAIGSAGFYFSKWDVWQGSGNVNLSTGLFEQVGGSMTDQSPGFGAGMRFSLPTGVFGTSLALEGGYLQLKFSNPSWKNSSNEEIFATFSANSTDKVELDFSGLRSKFEIRKFLSW
jgi:hypothetical protein